MIEVLSVIRVAKHIGVAPWELIRQPVYWYEMGELAVRIENTQYEGVKKAAMKAGK